MENLEKIPRMKTINECSKIVGLAKYYIRSLVLKNKVVYVRSGSKYLLNLDNLIDYLNNGENNIETPIQKANVGNIRKIGE